MGNRWRKTERGYERGDFLIEREGVDYFFLSCKGQRTGYYARVLSIAKRHANKLIRDNVDMLVGWGQTLDEDKP